MKDWIVLIIVQIEILAFVLIFALGVNELNKRTLVLESELAYVKTELSISSKKIAELQSEVVFLKGDNAVTRKIVDDTICGW